MGALMPSVAPPSHLATNHENDREGNDHGGQDYQNPGQPNQDLGLARRFIAEIEDRLLETLCRT
jgi:hypothetical protein